MAERVDIMVDIETLGIDIDSTILQVAAASFDIATGSIFDSFNQVVDIEEVDELNIDTETLKWWVTKNKDLFVELIKRGAGSSRELLNNFYNWLISQSEDMSNVYLWGNGILFDNRILKHQLEKYGLDYPIHYRNDRDVRTIIDVACMKSGMSVEEANKVKEKLRDKYYLKYDALNDVIYQIRLVSWAFNVIKETEE